MNGKNILRARRKELGLTQAQVAKAVGVSEATVSRWETGDIAEVGSGKLPALARALQFSPAQLLGDNNEDDELASYLEQLRSRPEMRAFFSLAKNATRREVQDAMRIVEAYFAGRTAGDSADDEANPGGNSRE